MLGQDIAGLQKTTWRWTLIGGIATVALGLLLLFWPGATLLAAALLIGFQMIAWGIMLILERAVNGDGAGSVILGIIGGVLLIMLGLAVMRAPGMTVGWMAVFLGAGWLVSGLFEAIEGLFDSSVEHRVWMIILGVLTAIAGVIVMSSPFASIGVLALWAGVLMVILGCVRIFAAFKIKNL